MTNEEFIKYLGAVKQDISHSRNELEIESTRESITEFENKSESLLRLHNETEEKIKIIETFLALREFENYITIYLTLNEKIVEKEKTNIKQKKVVKKFNTQYVNKKKSIINKINNMNDSVSIVTFKIESLFIERNKEEIITHITSIRDLNLHDCINTYHVNKVFLSEIYYFKGQLESYLKDKEIKESGIKGSFYKELLVILQQYQSLEITLPGIDKSISEFVFLINNELENNKQLRSIFDELSECIKIIDKIESDFKVIPKDLETLEFLYNKKEEKLSLLDDDEKTDSETEELQTEIKSSLKKIEFYKRLAEKNGISIDEDSGSSEIIQLRDKVVKENLAFSQIFMLSEKSFLEEISKMREQLESIKNRLSQNNNILGQYRAKLHDLESRKPHKLYKYSNQIDELSKKVDNLHQNFTEYDNFIRKISSGEKLTSAIETEYNEGISKYFANKIPEFPYINEFLKPQKIDFLNKLIILDNGREIDMKDISTGQSMSMYIQAVLNRPSDDKRRMVVIFDEGATMDSRSFEPIKKVLEKNTSENKVLFSVFAKAVDEELTVTKLI